MDQETVINKVDQEPVINKIDIYDDVNWKACEAYAVEWENGEEGEYYKKILCCKEVSSGKNSENKIKS